ncbi:MAG TPA: non-homologous end-joining DNA ligase [Dermatophilaceae bacterium]|nr:non-homologous end-joining DNA ligase [Dermatophilaceae bacterium]
MADAQVECPTPDGGSRSVRISSPDRVLWPGSGARPGITKLDLAHYVRDVGPAVLRRIGGRPVTLQRFPTGIEGEEFYSKNPPKGLPDYVRTVTMTYPSGRRHPQFVVDEVATAVWAVQMNTITLHPWPVTVTDAPGCLDQPDEVRIDLDPQPGKGFQDAVEAALALREVLAEAGLTGFPKTSGNRGVHVYAPICPAREFLDVRHGVIAIARELERRMPQQVTTAWWKEERGERVFVDYNQACRDRTIAAAYSPRPLPGAPVSMPVSWDALPHTDPRELTVLTVPDLVAAQGDPWAAYETSVGDLGTAMQWWERDVADGLPELAFPPDYPKMPGEPPRVQPSRKRYADEEYLEGGVGYLRDDPSQPPASGRQGRGGGGRRG